MDRFLSTQYTVDLTCPTLQLCVTQTPPLVAVVVGGTMISPRSFHLMYDIFN